MKRGIESNRDYLRFSQNIFSQNGEDGILQEILNSLPKSSEKWCVEFGAWDGSYLSNTFNLVSNFGWDAVYIEGNPKFYELLENTVSKNPRILPFCRMVSSELGSKDSLNYILQETPVPYDFSILSIDIDSYDLAVWASLDLYFPKIVIMEINSSIYPGIKEWHHESGRGNSFTSTLDVAKSKGYTLVCHTGNLIFVRNDLRDNLNLTKFQIEYPETLFNYLHLPVIHKRNMMGLISNRLKCIYEKLKFGR